MDRVPGFPLVGRRGREGGRESGMGEKTPVHDGSGRSAVSLACSVTRDAMKVPLGRKPRTEPRRASGPERWGRAGRGTSRGALQMWKTHT